MHLVRRHFLVPSFLVALTAVGCGQGSATLSPTGPTTALGGAALSADVSTATSSTAGSDRIVTLGRDDKGRGGGEKEDREDREDREDKQSGKPEKGVRGELSGFVTAANGTSITVRGMTVTPGPDAVIRHGNRILLFASIAVGNHVQARGTINDGTLVASEIKVERTDREDGDEGEVRGVVSGVTATTGCPVLTFSVGTTTVTTSAATEFDGILCTALANGAVVEVKGTRQTDGSIVATKVELEDDDLDDDEDGVKVEGQVSGLPGAGSCPTLSFTVGTKQVTTAASTAFEDVTCATLVNGMTVEVKGVLQANGSIAATKVELD